MRRLSFRAWRETRHDWRYITRSSRYDAGMRVFAIALACVVGCKDHEAPKPTPHVVPAPVATVPADAGVDGMSALEVARNSGNFESLMNQPASAPIGSVDYEPSQDVSAWNTPPITPGGGIGSEGHLDSVGTFGHGGAYRRDAGP
jgi:hypothetical protein